ncbi:hypothetical protein AAS21_gp108 [Pantoea phage vB_PagS_AAS21]|uniref:Uncharacterized protein n=1 Tax=Pantoea phage vB_PagS_AAS21 TaxID=2575261 RepID=A0A4Y5P1L6_9CAUD|nr:hypothetical protein AAS21_gp108 [Pantoea phage vB_PagS_AAS21]
MSSEYLQTQDSAIYDIYKDCISLTRDHN